MKVFSTTIKSLVNIFLPIIILVNLYAFVVQSGGHDFIGGFNFSKWQNTYFGFTSMIRLFNDLSVDWLYQEFVSVFRAFANMGTFYLSEFFLNLEGIKTVAQLLLVFFKWFYNVITFPYQLLLNVYNLFKFIGRFFVVFMNCIINLMEGYYNIPLESSNGWNTISDYVYVM